MIPVRRPILCRMIRLGGAHRDDGVKETPDFPNDTFELSHMGVREISLIRSWLDQLDRQRRQHQPPSAIGFTVNREHLPSVAFDFPMQFCDLAGWCCR